MHRRVLFKLLTAASLCSVSALAWSQAAAWPNKPVRILVGFPAGSTPDSAARALADGLSSVLSQPVIVDNKVGSSGNLAAGLVAKATDDHTLGVVINGNLTTAKVMNPAVGFDPDRDFAFLSLLTTAPMALVTQAHRPEGAAFFKEAVAQGDRWNYGSVGAGSGAHLGMEMLKTKVPGMKPVHIPFQGNPAVVTALIGGQIDLALVPPGLIMPHVKSGKLRIVGLTSGRSTLAPEAASLAEVGISDFSLEVWTAMVGPSNLSKAAQDRLKLEIPKLLRTPEIRQRLFLQGWNTVGSGPEGLQARVSDESAALKAVIKSANIKAD